MNRRAFIGSCLAAPLAPIKAFTQPDRPTIFHIRERLMPFEMDSCRGFWIHPKVDLRDLERQQILERF